MRRRSRAGGEPNKTRRHKTATLKRRAVHRPGPSAIDKETEVARHTRLLNELRQRTTDLTELLNNRRRPPRCLRSSALRLANLSLCSRPCSKSTSSYSPIIWHV